MLLPLMIKAAFFASHHTVAIPFSSYSVTTLCELLLFNLLFSFAVTLEFSYQKTVYLHPKFPQYHALQITLFLSIHILCIFLLVLHAIRMQVLPSRVLCFFSFAMDFIKKKSFTGDLLLANYLILFFYINTCILNLVWCTSVTLFENSSLNQYSVCSFTDVYCCQPVQQNSVGQQICEPLQ